MLSASIYRTAARHSGRHARAGHCLDERSVGEDSQVQAPAHRRRASVRALVPASALLPLAGCTGTRPGRARAPHRLPPAPNSVTTPAEPAGVSSAQPDSVSAQHAREPRVRPLAPCTKQRSPPSSATPAVCTPSSARTVDRIRSARAARPHQHHWHHASQQTYSLSRTWLCRHEGNTRCSIKSCRGPGTARAAFTASCLAAWQTHVALHCHPLHKRMLHQINTPGP